MRVLVADDQATVRSALRWLLKEQSGFRVVGEVIRGEKLLDQAAATQPDLVLLNWELRGLSPASRLAAGQTRRRLLDALHALRSHPKVIALSSRPEARQIALAAGADAFVSKGDPPERLLTTLRTINSERNSSGSVGQAVETSAADLPRVREEIDGFQVEPVEAV